MACPRFTPLDRDIQELRDLRQTIYVGKPPYHREVWATSNHNADDWNYWLCIQYRPDLAGRLDIKFQWWWGSWTREPIEDWTVTHLRYWQGPSIYIPRFPIVVSTDDERTLGSDDSDAASVN